MLKAQFSIIGLLLLFSCNQKIDTSQPQISQSQIDTVEKIIPKNEQGKFPSYYIEKASTEKQLNLPTLEAGVDSLQIRFWFGYAFSDTTQLVILKCKQNVWQSEVYSMFLNFNKDRAAITSISKSVVSPNTTSGWKALSKKFSDLKIADLPDMSALSGYPLIADGDGVVVEVATRRKCRIFSYHGTEIGAENEIEEA